MGESGAELLVYLYLSLSLSLSHRHCFLRFKFKYIYEYCFCTMCHVTLHGGGGADYSILGVDDGAGTCPAWTEPTIPQ